jgi:hypothetical protein
MQIDIGKIFANEKIIHLENCSTFSEAVETMVNYNIENVSYDVKTFFYTIETMFAIEPYRNIETDEKDNYILEYIIDNDTKPDIITNIKSNFDIKIKIGDNPLLDVDTKNFKIVSCCIDNRYRINIKFYIDKNKMKEELYLKYTCVLLNTVTRNKLINNDVITKDILYVDGFAIPINH